MRAAFYECDITPPLGGFVWGHYTEVRPQNVKDRLYARAMVTEGDNGEIAAFVTVDSCTLPSEMHDIVTKRIYEYTGIKPEQVCISSNHTHWGAPVCDSPEIDCFADATYRDVFFRKTADAVTLAYKRLDTAEAKFGTSTAEGIAFCRDYIAADGSVKTWSGEGSVGRISEPDPTVRVLVYERAGKPIGALVNFACHQCCCADNDYTGDFSSIFSKDLKKIYGEDFVSVFLLGTAGDINHIAGPGFQTAPDHYRMMGHKIADGVVDAIKTAMPVGREVAVIKEPLTISHRQATPAETTAMLQYLNDHNSMMRLRNMVYYAKTNTKTEGTYLMQALRIGNTCIYAMPGEVFIDFGYQLQAKTAYENAIVVENCNTYCGYVPTPAMFEENCKGVYEASLCYHSCLIPEAGDRMVEKLLELGERIR
ncbi:MAG: hypothetical protein IJX80_10645 [Clostridia bacterium]|nr:hypothetical protein [Clostridia bacterium]